VSQPLHDRSTIYHFLTHHGLTITHLPADTPAIPDSSLLIFRLGEEPFAIPVHTVRAIQPLGHYRPLPLTRSWVIGVVNVLGKFLTVLDIRSLADCELSTPGPDTPLLIVCLDGIELGLLVDSLIMVPRGVTNLLQSPLPVSLTPQGSW
jgi:chemotaxis signal transduction protein